MSLTPALSRREREKKPLTPENPLTPALSRREREGKRSSIGRRLPDRSSDAWMEDAKRRFSSRGSGAPRASG
jgi:hypothetical protein